jgi:hypothetical protein
MCVRACYYMACTSCGSQFRDPESGAYFESQEDVKEAAQTRNWQTDVRVKNGSLWDFCPRCYAAHVQEAGDAK